MSVQLKYPQFDKLVEAFREVDRDAESAAKKAANTAANVMQHALVESMQKVNKTGGMTGLISRMPPPEKDERQGVYKVRVGYEKGAYDPKNVSDGYKAVFINYGTPRRDKKKGRIAARNFLKVAQKKAKTQLDALVEQTQKEALRPLRGMKK